MRYFLDTEFNGMGGELISLALVSEVGRELYLTSYSRPPSIPWVAKNVIPIIQCSGATPIVCFKQHMGHMISEFLEKDSKPLIIADWPADIAYLCNTLIVGPGEMVPIKSLAFEIMRVDAYPTDLPGAVQHNALWDARALRHKIMHSDGV